MPLLHNAIANNQLTSGNLTDVGMCRQFPMRVFARLLLVGKGVISNGVTISVLGILDDPCHARVARWQLPRIPSRMAWIIESRCATS
jgi:hypothetical protein